MVKLQSYQQIVSTTHSQQRFSLHLHNAKRIMTPHNVHSFLGNEIGTFVFSLYALEQTIVCG
jgi:hypothetical protein